MYVKIEFMTDNAAFDEPDYAEEITRILRKTAGEIGWHGNNAECDGTVKDLNGNTIGEWSVSAE